MNFESTISISYKVALVTTDMLLDTRHMYTERFPENTKLSSAYVPMNIIIISVILGHWKNF